MINKLFEYNEFSIPLGNLTTLTTKNFEEFCNQSNNKFIKQIHSNILIDYNEIINSDKVLEGDGIYLDYSKSSNLDNIVFSIQTADCIPLLLLSSTHVFLVHAGWQGLYKKIIQECFQIDPSINFALIGPCISQSNYEVGEEFLNYFSTKESFARTNNNKLMFNLRHEATNQILSFNSKIKVFDTTICTFDTKKLFSHRREPNMGRNFHIYSFKKLTF